MAEPLLKKLAMEAPGTFSHSLLIGSIAEAAAEAVGCNGLLCRVGAYYHDIGKINKPMYFVENQAMDVGNRHERLSPAMSHLIILPLLFGSRGVAKEVSPTLKLRGLGYFFALGLAFASIRALFPELVFLRFLRLQW